MTTTSRSIRLVVLDWAGTAIDFGCFAPVVPFVQALERQGVAITPEQARIPMGLAKKDHLRALLELPEVAEQWRSRHGQSWDESDVERIYRENYIPLQLGAVSDHDRLVPGLLDVVAELRSRGILIATTTGYFREAGELVFASAERQGYHRDCDVLPDEVPTGRPAPWMIFRAMQTLGVYPPQAVVKVGDTVVDIQEARNAGAWSVGVVASSSEVGLTEAAWAALSEKERRSRIDAVGERFREAGAHAVIETLVELPAVVDDVGRR